MKMRSRQTFVFTYTLFKKVLYTVDVLNIGHSNSALKWPTLKMYFLISRHCS